RSTRSAPELRRKKLMSCVRPGVLETKASRTWPTSVLIALDLPALERPANAISAPAGGGKPDGLAIDISNCALRNRGMKKFGEKPVGCGRKPSSHRAIRLSCIRIPRLKKSLTAFRGHHDQAFPAALVVAAGCRQPSGSGPGSGSRQGETDRRDTVRRLSHGRWQQPVGGQPQDRRSA